MALVTIQTIDGPRQARVCDYCKAVFTTSRFCSGRCARAYEEQRQIEAAAKQKGSDA